jgi:hypothetical protein
MSAPVTPLDRDHLSAALHDADLRVLLMCVFHITGDRRWLNDPFRPHRDVQLIADESAGLAPTAADELRSVVLDVLTRDDVRAAIADPGVPPGPDQRKWKYGTSSFGFFQETKAGDCRLCAKRWVKWHDSPKYAQTNRSSIRCQALDSFEATRSRQ